MFTLPGLNDSESELSLLIVMAAMIAQFLYLGYQLLRPVVDLFLFFFPFQWLGSVKSLCQRPNILQLKHLSSLLTFCFTEFLLLNIITKCPMTFIVRLLVNFASV